MVCGCGAMLKCEVVCGDETGDVEVFGRVGMCGWCGDTGLCGCLGDK